MIDELIQRVITVRDQAHLAHWSTKSFSEHMALGDFYDGVISSLDNLVENYQGYKGLVKNIKIKAFETPDNILDTLKEDVKWINENRDKISYKIPSLANILDDLTSVYTKAIYKITNLK